MVRIRGGEAIVFWLVPASEREASGALGAQGLGLAASSAVGFGGAVLRSASPTWPPPPPWWQGPNQATCTVASRGR